MVLGEGFYMTEEYVDRGMYYSIPRNDLTVSDCTAEDYVSGPLEDWIEGALAFDGQARFAALTHAEMTRDGKYRGSTYEGSRRKTVDMGTNNFLIEVYFKAARGHRGGTLVSKTDGRSGYELGLDGGGAVTLTLYARGAPQKVAGPRVNDGRWHHLIAEVDRAAGKVNIYVDGKQATGERLTLAQDASLANTADFLVGKGHGGRFFAGAIDFLRVSRGTLADAKTTIGELYEWQFNGPQSRDFCGNKPTGKRDAGAIEYRPE